MTRATKAFHKKKHEPSTPFSEMKRHRFNAEKKAPVDQNLSKQEKERARRRLRKKKLALAQTTCYTCRESGHTSSTCPSSSSNDKQCYRCASLQHTTKSCPIRADPANPYPHAICFVCKATGHLASACVDNEKGVYPDGGSCRWCGSVEHLARNCKGSGVVLGTGGKGDDDLLETVPVVREVKKVSKGKKKVVVF